MKKQPHQHAELIKLWADGYEIEWYDIYNQEWRLFAECDTWNATCKYRIKPEPKPDREVFWKADLKGLYGRLGIMGSNLKLTFDGETGDLKKAEVLHGR